MKDKIKEKRYEVLELFSILCIYVFIIVFLYFVCNFSLDVKDLKESDELIYQKVILIEGNFTISELYCQNEKLILNFYEKKNGYFETRDIKQNELNMDIVKYYGQEE